MTFHGGFKEQILFDQWNTQTVGGKYISSFSLKQTNNRAICFLLAFVGSWFAVFFIAVLYEALKALRDNLTRRDFCETCSQPQNPPQAM